MSLARRNTRSSSLFNSPRRLSSQSHGTSSLWLHHSLSCMRTHKATAQSYLACPSASANSVLTTCNTYVLPCMSTHHRPMWAGSRHTMSVHLLSLQVHTQCSIWVVFTNARPSQLCAQHCCLQHWFCCNVCCWCLHCMTWLYVRYSSFNILTVLEYVEYGMNGVTWGGGRIPSGVTEVHPLPFTIVFNYDYIL